MGKKLSGSDIILLSIAGIFDFFQEIKDPAGLISSYYQNFYGFVPQRWKKINIYKIIHINRKQKLLTKINKKLFLTPQGEKYLKNKFPTVFFRMEKWNGYFYFIFFDVTELRRPVRDKLRRILKQLKFAPLQKSVWVTINKKLIDLVLKFKKDYHLNKEIFIVKSKIAFKKDLPLLLNQLWHLDSLNKKYQKIFSRYQDLLTKYKKEKNLFSLINELSQINKDFYQITMQDPFFPRCFLPKKWSFFECLKIRRKIVEIIKIKKRNV